MTLVIINSMLLAEQSDINGIAVIFIILLFTAVFVCTGVLTYKIRMKNFNKTENKDDDEKTK